MNSRKLEAWRPIEVTLEDAALRAATTRENTLVVAGPGAGKTELLAQRASFLLETSVCPSPHRILAISFKRDAASNLRDRVIRRCGRELASRFDSMTFDAFAKDLIDRFRLALPDNYRPSADYTLLTDKVDKYVWEGMQALPDAVCPLTGPQRNQIRRKKTGDLLAIYPLPTSNWSLDTVEKIGVAGLWSYWLNGLEPSQLTFPMVTRLAEYLLRENPLLLNALRGTYRFVFLDEFQDTTRAQYALTRIGFQDSSCIVTAVGDNKQQIMKWAGAFAIFPHFKEDFEPEVEELTKNHRSVSSLVDIQHFFAKALDAEAAPVASGRIDADKHGECFAWAFPDEEVESAYLATRVQAWIEQENLSPRDICILTRMKSAEYCERLITQLAQIGIKARVEDDFQRTLFEPCIEAVFGMLKLAAKVRSPGSWESALHLLAELDGDRTDENMRRQSDALLAFARKIRAQLAPEISKEDQIRKIVNQIVMFFGRDRISGRFPQYAQGRFFDDLIEQLVAFLVEARSRYEWSGAIDDVEGTGSLPILTIHKSKGLEFNTVIFVGLEDDAFWGFNDDPDSETCALFVALSRAKDRAVFTFSSSRSVGKYAQKTRDSIESFYKLFEQAGVEIEEIPGM